MKTFFYLLILFTLPLFTYAQFNTGYSFDIPEGSNIENEQAAIDWITDFIKTEKKTASQWQIDYTKESRVGKHYAFKQYFQDHPIFKTAAKINVSKSGKVISLSYNFVDLSNVEIKNNTIETRKQNELVIENYLRDNPSLQLEEKEVLWFYNENNNNNDNPNQETYNQLQIAEQIWVKETQSGKGYQVLLSQDGIELDFSELQSYVADDTTATGMVFLPDPLTSAAKNYASPYSDDEDSDIIELNAERFPVDIDVTYENGLFILENPYVIIDDSESPPFNSPAAVTGDGNFQFTRAQQGFEDVNALFHITEYQKYIQSLGFDDLFNSQITVDPHGASSQDNSFFRHSGKVLIFGEGGVDDAEDADVIIHEYGHALSDNASPSSNLNASEERRALDEAYGDYFASSYSRSFSDYNWGNVFSWDGHNQYWAGRQVDSDKHYPEDMENYLYPDSEIFSSAMMDVYNALGRETADILVLESLYNNINTTTFPEVALTILSIDQNLFQGQNQDVLRGIFCSRGFIDCSFSAGVNQTICLGEEAMIGVPSDVSLEQFNITWSGNNIIEGRDTWTPTVFPENSTTYFLETTNVSDQSTTIDSVQINVELCNLEEYESIKLINTINFTSGLQNPIVVFPKETANSEIAVFDANGKLLNLWKAANDEPRVLPIKHLPSGYYIVNIKNEAMEEDLNFKVVKAR